MATPQYRAPGICSPRGQAFLDSLGFKDTADAGYQTWQRAIVQFESASIIYEFEDALLAMPFTVVDEEQLAELESLHKHIRIITGAEVGESLFEKSKSGARSSDTATQLLLQMMLTNSITKEDAHKLVIQLAK